MGKSWPDGTAAETWRNWRLLRSKRKEPATMIHRTWKSPRKVPRQRVSKDSEVVPTLLYIHIIFIHVPKRNEELNRKYNSFLWCYNMMSIQYIYNIIILILHIYIHILQYTNIEHLIQTLLAQKWKYLRHLFDPIVPWSHGNPLCTPGSNNQWRTKRDRLEEDKNLSEVTTTPGLEMKDPSKWGIFLLIRTVQIGSKA